MGIIGDKDEQLLNCLSENSFQWPMKLFDAIPSINKEEEL